MTPWGLSAPKVAPALDVADSSVYRIKRRFAGSGLDGVLKDRPQVHRYRRLDDRAGAPIIALALPLLPRATATGCCGRLADKVVELGLVESLPCEAVRLHRKSTLKRPYRVRGRLWRNKHWRIPEVSADFTAHMEDVLDLYAESYIPQKPVVCFDEISTQLLADMRPGLTLRSGPPRRQPGL